MSTTSLAFDILARDRSSSTFDRVGSSAQGAGRKVSGFGSTLLKWGKRAAIAAGVAGTLAAKWGIDAVRAAADDEEAQVSLAKALRDNARASDEQLAATERWIAAQGRVLGVADEELRPALQKLATATRDIGDGQKFTALAMDVAAGRHKKLATVAEALEKAINGNTSGLSRLGIKTKDAAGETLTLERITRRLADTYGGQAAKRAETANGKFQRLKVTYEETKEAIGAKLLPYAVKLADWMLDKGIPAVTKLASWLGDKLGPAFAAVGSFIRTKVVPFFQSFNDKSSKTGGFIDAVRDALADAAPFFDLIGRMAKAAAKIFMSVVWPALKWAADKVFPFLIKGIRLSGEAIGALGRMGKWLWNNALQPAFKSIVKGIAWVLGGWATMLRALSKVPRFDWADSAADKMERTAAKARAIAEGIKKIPTHKDVDVTIRYRHMGRPSPIDPLVSAPGPHMTGRRPNVGATVVSGSAGSADLGTFTLNLMLDGRTLQKVLLKLKRENGGLALGLA